MSADQPPSSVAGPGPGMQRRSFLKRVGAAAGAAVVGRGAARAEAESASTSSAEGVRVYPAAETQLTLRVNGTNRTVPAHPSDTLVQVLRERLGLTGTKNGCDRGACGSCTVLVDGRSVNACLLLAVDAEGADITTVEGLSNGDRLHPIQQSFVAHDACQCGACIPGFIMRSHALLAENPRPTHDEIRRGLSGNICRCACYPKIFEAVRSVRT